LADSPAAALTVALPSEPSMLSAVAAIPLAAVATAVVLVPAAVDKTLVPILVPRASPMLTLMDCLQVYAV